MDTLYTIGYEGMAQETLLHTLIVNTIETLVDIRQLPLSRKPGFSKTALASGVNRVGIGYQHLRALGTPPAIRAVRKINHDKEAFRRDYLAYVDTQGDALNYLAEKLRNERLCLLCYEADATDCHRSLVAERLQERLHASGTTLNVVHLAAEPQTGAV